MWTIGQAYERLGSVSAFYDGMMSNSSLLGRLAMYFLWQMDAQKYVEFKAQALRGIPSDFSGSLLEVPIGTGVLTLPLYKDLPGASIVGVDYSASMLAAAKERALALGFAASAGENFFLLPTLPPSRRKNFPDVSSSEGDSNCPQPYGLGPQSDNTTARPPRMRKNFPGGTTASQNFPWGTPTLVNAECGMRNSELEATKTSSAGKIKLIQADVGALPFGSDSFDIVLSIDGFHVFPDKDAAFKETHRVLKTGGVLCGCMYVAGLNRVTDFFVRHFCERFGFFTPPYETLESLEARLSKMYSAVSVSHVESFAGFLCKK